MIKKKRGILLRGQCLFKMPVFLSTITLFSVLNTSLICMVMVPFFKDSGMLPIQISMILLSKKIVRLFSDSFFGILFDKYGARFVFFIGRVVKLFSFVVLYITTPKLIYFIIAMIFDGLSYSAIHGKVSVYVYNNLFINQKTKLYNRIVSSYYLFSNLLIAIMSFSAGALLKQHGYNFLIQISIITNILSFFLLFFIKNYNHFIDDKYCKKNQNNKTASVFTIISNIKILLKEKPMFVLLILFYSIVNFLSWQFGSLASLILLDMGISSSNLASAGALLKISMSIGCCLPIFFLHNGLNIKHCINIFTLCIIFGCITALTYSKIMMVIFMCLIVFIYATIQTSIEKTIDAISTTDIRATSVSIATTLCTLITIISIITSGIVAQYFSYQTFFIMILVLLLYLLFFLRKRISIMY